MLLRTEATLLTRATSPASASSTACAARLADLFLAIAIYAAQIPFSRWWLSTHRYGPMELVWRRLTYGRITAA
jgi:uncharacterized membrane protein YeiB